MKEKDENKFIFKNKTHLQRPEIQIQKEKKKVDEYKFSNKKRFYRSFHGFCFIFLLFLCISLHQEQNRLC